MVALISSPAVSRECGSEACSLMIITEYMTESSSTFDKMSLKSSGLSPLACDVDIGRSVHTIIRDQCLSHVNITVYKIPVSWTTKRVECVKYQDRASWCISVHNINFLTSAPPATSCFHLRSAMIEWLESHAHISDDSCTQLWDASRRNTSWGMVGLQDIITRMIVEIWGPST